MSIALSTQRQTTRAYLKPRRNKSISLDYQVAIDIARLDSALGRWGQLTVRWSLHNKDNKVIILVILVMPQG